MNINGEKSHIQKYIENFSNKLSNYPDTYFEKTFYIKVMVEEVHGYQV
jgi:hypothetical protein